MSADDRRSEADADADAGAVPKLTIGQRLLTALPRVGTTTRPDDGAARAAAARAAGAARSADDRAADDRAADETRVAADEPRAGEPGRDEPVPDRAGATRPAKGGATGKATSGMTKDELVVAIKRIDDQERKIGLLIAPIGAVVGVLLMISAIHLNPAVGHKNHVSASVFIWEGVARVVLAILVAVAAFTRRRSFLGFALLFLGTALGSPIVALPFWFVGGWLIWRAFKWQKELAAMTGGQRRPASGRREAARSEPRNGTDPRTRAGAGAAAPRRAKKRQPAARGPEPSKRYTPPKPTRPKPPAPST